MNAVVPVNVMPIGLDERSQRALSSAFIKHCHNLVTLSSPDQAQVAVLDLDNSNAAKLLSNFRKTYPGMSLIGLGKQQPKLSVNAYVAKPVDIHLLMDTISKLATDNSTSKINMITTEKIAKAMQALENKNIAKSLNNRLESTQNQPASKRVIPKKTDKMCFDHERFLLGAIQQAVAQAKARLQIAVLSCWKDKTIIVDPAQNIISTNLKDSQIRSLAIAPIDDNLSPPIQSIFCQPDDAAIQNTLLQTNDLRHINLEVFLWNLGLLTCRGRIHAEVSISNRQYLQRWPNLTRIIVPDNAMRILAYWVQQPCSLHDIKEQLNVPWQDVFTIFSAAFAAGLAGEAKRNADEIVNVIELNAHKKRGLMSSIINRLRRNKTTNDSITV